MGGACAVIVRPRSIPKIDRKGLTNGKVTRRGIGWIMVKDHSEMIKDLVDSPRYSGFSKWEQDFLTRVDEQVDLGNFLSEKQRSKIADIHNKHFG